MEERCPFKGTVKGGEKVQCELREGHPGQHFVILRNGRQLLVKPKS